MSNVQDIITDVADALNLSSGCDIGSTDQKRIIRGIKRILDRYSIDARKLPTICQVEHKLKTCDNRLSVGKGKRWDIWGEPVAIHYAAWKGCTSVSCGTYTTNSGTTVSAGGICEIPIRVSNDVGLFHRYSTCRETHVSRPTEMYYQRGEIVFNSKPWVGDTLILRAAMPFNDELLLCEPTADCDKPEYEFSICPDHLLDDRSRNEVLCMAEADFDGDECWVGEYCVKPCADECADPIDVIVKPVKMNDFCPETFKLGEMGDLPAGYYDAIVRTLIYDMANYAGMERDVFMRKDRDDANVLLHRSNNIPKPHQKDLTTYWSRRRGCAYGDLQLDEMLNANPRGNCCD